MSLSKNRLEVQSSEGLSVLEIESLLAFRVRFET
jgi:hypothetical protein